MFSKDLNYSKRFLFYSVLYTIMVNATSIQVSTELKKTLEKRKIVSAESYEEVIWDLLEDTMELSEETKRSIEKSEEDIRKGRVHKWEDVKKEMNINV